VIVKCLSIRQPHATRILTGAKVEEYRSWLTHHRGPLAIHAGSTLVRAAFEDAPELDPKRVKRSMVLGVVDLVDCIADVYGGYAWILGSPRWLREPIPMKGRLGLFDVEIPEESLSA
jgi:activating signal cointegrator 1